MLIETTCISAMIGFRCCGRHLSAEDRRGTERNALKLAKTLQTRLERKDGDSARSAVGNAAHVPRRAALLLQTINAPSCPRHEEMPLIGAAFQHSRQALRILWRPSSRSSTIGQ